MKTGLKQLMMAVLMILAMTTGLHAAETTATVINFASGETMWIIGLILGGGVAVYRTAARHARQDAEQPPDNDEESPKNS